MVFHCPFPVRRAELQSANLARPVHMLAGFRAAGFRVILITGNAGQRRRRIARLKRLVDRGLAVAFVYSETSNLPLFFNEAHRLPVHPFLEYRFFRWLRGRGIPVGLFLRDLHWRFPHFRRYPLYKRLPALLFYRLDWRMYQSRCDRLFLPSAGLGEHLPTKMGWERIQILPPGCEEREAKAEALAGESGEKRRGIALFYVGGVTAPPYDLTPIFSFARLLPGESVVVCCRQDEWQKVGSYYGAIPNNMRIVHAQGEELERYYRNADIFFFTLAAYEYFALAMPYKVFEAVAYSLPILTFAGTEVARWVQAEGAGWVARDLDETVALIAKLRENRQLIIEKRIHLRELARKHSWTNRARAVAEALGAGKAVP